jgi:hypothetical protein
MPNTVPAAIRGLPSFTDIAVDAILDDDRSQTIGTSHFMFEPHWGEPVLAPAAAPPVETGLEITQAGRAYLLLMDIITKLHIEGDTASFTLTPEMADDLAAFGSESEDCEEDADAEDSDPAEDGHDHEADCWAEEVP